MEDNSSYIYTKKLGDITNQLTLILYQKKIFTATPTFFNTQAKIKVPHSLLPLCQAGAMSIGAIINSSKENIYLNNYLLERMMLITPCEDIFIKKFDLNIVENYSQNNFPISSAIFCKNVNYYICDMPFMNLCALHLPFLKEAIIKGICPISFFYYVIILPEPERFISFTLSLLKQSFHNDEKVIFPITHKLLGLKSKKEVNFLSDFVKFELYQKGQRYKRA